MAGLAQESNTAERPVDAADRELALALMAGDEAAPRAACLRFSAMVRRIVRRTLGPDEDAEDVVQDIFLRIFQQLSTLREPVALRAFVVAIAVRAAHCHVRRTSWLRQRARFDSCTPLDELGGNLDVESQYALIRLGRVLERVRECDRAAFVLRYVEGRKLDDIAMLLGSSKPTVQRRLARARARVNLLAQRDTFLMEYTRGVTHSPAR
jgi:RNA polymerase sigma-70 factor, ECF subfamily